MDCSSKAVDPSPRGRCGSLAALDGRTECGRRAVSFARFVPRQQSRYGAQGPLANDFGDQAMDLAVSSYPQDEQVGVAAEEDQRDAVLHMEVEQLETQT